MIQNNLFPLAIYDDINKQARFKWYAYGNTYAQPFTYKKIPPFQIIFEDENTNITAFTLHSVADGSTVNILGTMINEHGLAGNNGLIPGKKLYTNFSTDPLIMANVDYGDYYVSFVAEGNTYYSDVFRWCEDLSDKIKITYYHTEHFPISNGVIYYGENYQNEFFIDSEVGKPEYEFNEEETTRDGIKFYIYQVSTKKYRFEFQAPEYILDALRLIWMTDVVNITYQGNVYSVDSILFTPEWDDHGFLATIETEFTTGTVLAMTGRAIGNTDVYDTPDTPPIPEVEGGDYNDDYNNDYNNN